MSSSQVMPEREKGAGETLCDLPSVWAKEFDELRIHMRSRGFLQEPAPPTANQPLKRKHHDEFFA